MPMNGAPFVFIPPAETRGRKRAYHAEAAASTGERVAKHKAKKQAEKIERIAVLDMETDPFDNVNQGEIFPFVACLYTLEFGPVVIWDENRDSFIERLIAAILELPDKYIIYAHNGGKFDFMFFVHKVRGAVSFKGRGIMLAQIGPHELRDSFHIIPTRLADIQKDVFDYSLMAKGKRGKHKKAIIKYLIHDCEYLFDVVRDFLERFGLKLSVGQAAMIELKKHYRVERLGENADEFLRQYFFGGRVECIAGRGHFKGDYKLYDVNSMYPYVMANFQHPIGNDYRRRRKGGIGPATVFVEVSCENYGALIMKNLEGETTARERRGRFFTSIWEFDAAVELDLIDNIKIHSVIDCAVRSDFSNFILPTYEARQKTKEQLSAMRKQGLEGKPEYMAVVKEDLFLKLLMNNAYGKFAQNPRKFKEYFITDPNDSPPEGFEDFPLPHFRCDEYAIWQRPVQHRYYNNVGTAASITGAARSVLLRAIVNATDPIYCDTDSLICRDVSGVLFDDAALGAWGLESEFSEVIIAGKKLYATKGAGPDPQIKVKSKGTAGLEWTDMQRLLDDEILEIVNKAPTMTRRGDQYYISRHIRATAPRRKTHEVARTFTANRA